MIDLIKEIWQTMCTNKLRTFLTGLSVAWGIFMLILLLAISNGVVKAFENTALNDNPYAINIWGGSTTLPYQGMKEGRSIELSERDFEEVKNGDKNHITSVSGTFEFNTTLSTEKDYVAKSCTGVFPDDMRGDMKLVQGRFINQADINESRKVIVITKDVAETLFRNPDKAVGQLLSASGLTFTVVGIYDHHWRDDVFIPYTTARALNGFNDKISELRVNIANVSTEADGVAVEKNVRKALSKRSKFDPADENALWVHNRFTNFLQTLFGLKVLNITMWVIGILTLITGIVGVSNIMFVSVRERTHEIGIRRAIGAKRGSILRQIVLESVAMTTVFGYIGIVMGTVATEIVKKVFEGSEFMVAPSVDLNIALEVTLALIVAGALAGVFPAMRATKVRPVEALRDE